MQVNCILEAFGHAKTARNNNSSRFVKLLTIQYCDKRRTLLRGKLHFNVKLVSFTFTSIFSVFSLFSLSLEVVLFWFCFATPQIKHLFRLFFNSTHVYSCVFRLKVVFITKITEKTWIIFTVGITKFIIIVQRAYSQYKCCLQPDAQ